MVHGTGIINILILHLPFAKPVHSWRRPKKLPPSLLHMPRFNEPFSILNEPFGEPVTHWTRQEPLAKQLAHAGPSGCSGTLGSRATVFLLARHLVHRRVTISLSGAKRERTGVGSIWFLVVFSDGTRGRMRCCLLEEECFFEALPSCGHWQMFSWSSFQLLVGWLTKQKQFVVWIQNALLSSEPLWSLEHCKMAIVSSVRGQI